MQGWSEYMCGAEIPVYENDKNYELYCKRNLERLNIMVKNDAKIEPDNCLNSWMLWALLWLA
jgi:hypothetical protein